MRRVRDRGGIVFPLLALVAFSACGGGPHVLGGRLAERPDAAVDAGVVDAADVAVAPDAAESSLCTGGGLLVTTARGAACAGEVASQAFRFALCSCNELSWTTSLTTDSFDSTTGQRGQNAAVGIDGHVVASPPFQVGGSFWIAGQPSAGLPGLAFATLTPSEVAKDLHVGGGFASQIMQTVRGDLYTDGNVTCTNLVVGGTIHASPGAVVISGLASNAIVREPVTVSKPCDCSKPALDTAATVAGLAQTNDNQSRGFAGGALNFVAPQVLELACGRYHLQSIMGSELTLRLRGRTAIAVSGDVVLSGALTVELQPGAELDLFILGDLRVPLGLLGNAARPAAVRIYIAGTSVVLPRGAGVGANIYAPAAAISVGGAVEIAGAIFGQRLSLGGATTVHYDEAILRGRACTPAAAPTTCTSCRDCNAEAACRQGACTVCMNDAECCAPLTCQSGRCLPPVLRPRQ